MNNRTGLVKSPSEPIASGTPELLNCGACACHRKYVGGAISYLFVARTNSGRGNPRIDWLTVDGNDAAELIALGARQAALHLRRPASEHVVDRRAQIDPQVGLSSTRTASSAACIWGNRRNVRMFAK